MMVIRELLKSIYKRPLMYIGEKKIEYIYYLILGKCSEMNDTYNQMDYAFIGLFEKWLDSYFLENKIKNNKSGFFWYKSIIECYGDKSYNAFFSLVNQFYNDYDNNTDYFKKHLK